MSSIQLHLIATRIATSEIPDREPDRIDEYGNKIWELSGNRELKISPKGSKYWTKNNIRHREDGPAIEENGSKFWYLNGKFHRNNGPAVEWSSGSKFWYRKGKFHREDGPAVELINGNVQYWLNGKQFAENIEKEQWEDLVDLERIRQVMED